MNDIINYYNNYDEDGRLLKKNRLPEYITTMRYIEKYLKFLFAICEREDLVGISQHMLDIFRKE